MEWTELEKRALPAVNLSSFPLNLKKIRDEVENVLKEVGRYGFFDEYTDHSFSHVKGMLSVAEWLIPESSKVKLTSADYLFLVLSIYFHDMGMLISRSEFSDRENNHDFQKFRSEPVLSMAQYNEFEARLKQLPPEQAERVLYQEFVRLTHGKRIKAWIEGSALDDNDASHNIRKVLSDLFSALDATVKRDLALVCESHTIDDINDINKYKISQPYGVSPDETVNLQYVAAILRTVDLLQITKGRAPSALYQIINPTDPLSQIEWQKQGAVRSVRPQLGMNRDGVASSEIQSATIEIHADFKNSDGFFGLTSYLVYAERELQATNTAILRSAPKLADPPIFPWRFIDSRAVEARGFLTESFGFTLDQQKILDLLTGHTLYNDTTVVLRELTQNALDAVRLQSTLEVTPGVYHGEIKIDWNSATRTLEVIDNGTGMSQDVIEKHLLKVGSSRYQDPMFKEKYPSFSSISRFGIGVLSAFMVSDDVEITTCSPDDQEARRIALRSVHGKYLIKLLDKIKDRKEIGVYPNGTSVKIVLRPTAVIGEVYQIAKMWLMFPGNKVAVRVDGGEWLPVGYASPKAAIESFLSTSNQERRFARRDIEVLEVTKPGVTLAFAVAKSKFFKDRSFVEINQDRVRYQEDSDKPPVSTCVEGVGVEFNTPGFRGLNILAIANATGPTAPKTNVARSAFEDTSELREMLANIYRLYSSHLSSEIERLASEDGFSLSRAVAEAPYIAAPLLGKNNVQAVRSSSLTAAINETPMVIVESDGDRRNISFTGLSEIGSFWTVDSSLSKSVETFIREAPSNTTSAAMLKSLQNADGAYPSGLTLCNFYSSEYVSKMVADVFEVSSVVASESHRNLKILWTKKSEVSNWLSSKSILFNIFRLDRRFWTYLSQALETVTARRGGQALLVPSGAVKMEGLDGFGGFSSAGNVFLKVGEPIVEFLRAVYLTGEPGSHIRKLGIYFVVLEAIIAIDQKWATVNADAIKRILEPNIYNLLAEESTDLEGLLTAVRASSGLFFSASAWDR